MKNKFLQRMLMLLISIVMISPQVRANETKVFGVTLPTSNTYTVKYNIKRKNWSDNNGWVTTSAAVEAGFTFEGKKLYIQSYETADGGWVEQFELQTYDGSTQKYSKKIWDASASGKDANHFNTIIYEWDGESVASQYVRGTDDSQYNISTSKTYFDATGWSETNIRLVVGHASYQKYREMGHVTGTKLYYNNNLDSWNDAMGFGIVGGEKDGTRIGDGRGYGYWLTDVSAHANEFTGMRHYGLNNNGDNVCYLVVNHGKAGEYPDVYYDSNYRTYLNSTQTVNSVVREHDGYVSGNAKQQINISSYELTSQGSTTQRTPNMSTSESSETVSACRTATTTFSTSGAIASHYQFDGFWTDATSGTRLDNGVAGTYTYYPTAATTVYARFSRIRYTLTYHDDGKTGGSVPVASETIYSGESVTVKDNTGRLVKAGKVFAGWASGTAHRDAGTVDYIPGVSDTFTASGNVDLYPVWKDGSYFISITDPTTNGVKNTTDFISSNSLTNTATEVNGVTFSKSYYKTSANQTSIKEKYQDSGNFIVYDTKSTATTIRVYVKNTHTSSANLYYYLAKEGSTSETDQLVSLSSGEKKVINIDASSTKGCRVIFSDNQYDKLFITQIIAIESGTTLPLPGQAGYELAFPGRVASHFPDINGMEIRPHNTLKWNYSEELRLQSSSSKYVKFTTTAATRLQVKIQSGSGFYVCTDKSNPSTTGFLTSGSSSGTKEIYLDAANTYYIMGENGSNTKIDKISFASHTACTAPTGLSAGSITYKGATFTVTDGTNANNYEFYVSTTSTAPTASSTPTYTSTSKTLVVDDLTKNTTYYAWVRTNGGYFHKSSWTALTGTTFKTLNAYDIEYDCDGATYGCPEDGVGLALPNPLPDAPFKPGYSFDGWYTDNEFEDEASAGASISENTTLYAKWTKVYASGTRDFQSSATVGTSPSKTISTSEVEYNPFRLDNIFFGSCKLAYDNGSTSSTGLGNNYNGWKIKKSGSEIKFYVENDAIVSIYLGTISSGSGKEPQIKYTSSETGSSVTTTCTTSGYKYECKVESNTMLTISTRDNATVTLQKIDIVAQSSCSAPTSLTNGTTRYNSQVVSWTAGDSETAWDVYRTTSSDDPTGSTEPTAAGVTSNSYTFTGLTASTTYYWWVRAACGVSDKSDWVEGTSFTTSASVVITGAVNTAGYGTVSPSSITVTSGSSVSISDNVLTCDGATLTATPTTQTAQYTYAFSSWSGVSNGDEITSAKTATANFTRTGKSYTITLDKQVASNSATGSVSATYGSAMPSIATLPSHANYTFGGFYTAVAGGGTQYYTNTGASAKNADFEEETTLYAKFTQTITVDDNGGTSDGTVTVLYNATSATITTAPVYEGFTLNKYISPDGKANVLNSDGSFCGTTVTDGDSYNYITSSKWAATGATALKAYWKCNTPTITCTSNVVTMTVPDGATVYYTSTTDGSAPSDPTSGSTAYNPSSKPEITQDTKFKAIAIKDGCVDSDVSAVTTCEYVAPTYSVTYKANNGTAESDVVRGTESTFASNSTTSFTAPATKAFTGWNTEADGTGKHYDVGDAVPSNLTVYADWKYKVYYIASSTSESNDVTAALATKYVVSVHETTGTSYNASDYSDYALVVLSESLTGSDAATDDHELKVIVGLNKPILNLKSYFYGADGDASKRWKWGAPNAGKKPKKVYVKNDTYANLTSHPIFSGLSITSDSISVLRSVSGSKPIQPIGSFASGCEGYTLALVPNKSTGSGTAIHELTAAQRSTITSQSISSKYLMISIQEGELSNLSDDGKTLIKNAANYLITGSQWVPQYAITHSAAENGSYTIKVGSASAVSTSTMSAAGTTITLAATPADGYGLSAWNVTKTVGGATVTVTDNQFTMPAEAVTIAPTFVRVYTVTYALNGGKYDGSTIDPTETAKQKDDVFNMPSLLPTYTNYGFGGWRCNLTNKKYAPGQAYTMTGINTKFIGFWIYRRTIDPGVLYTAENMKANTTAAISGTEQFHVGASATGMFNFLGAGNADAADGPMGVKDVTSSAADITISGEDFDYSLLFHGASNVTSSIPTSRAIDFSLPTTGDLHIYYADDGGSHIKLVDAEGTSKWTSADKASGYKAVVSSLAAGTYYLYATGGTPVLYGLYLDAECTALTDEQFSYSTTEISDKTYETDKTAKNTTLVNTLNLDVTYASSDENVATVAWDGTVTIHGAGTATISAIANVQKKSTTYYCTKEATYSLVVAKADMATTVSVSAYGAKNITHNAARLTYKMTRDYTKEIGVGQVKMRLYSDAGTLLNTYTIDNPELNGYYDVSGLTAGTTYRYSAQLIGDANHNDGDECVYTSFSTEASAPLYTVYFDKNDGSSPTSTTQASAGAAIAMPSAPTKTDYTFDGWYIGATKYAAGASYTPTEDVTAYALWTPDCASGGGGSGDPVALFTQNFTSAGEVAYAVSTDRNYTKASGLSNCVGDGDNLFTSITSPGATNGGIAINSKIGFDSKDISGKFGAYASSASRYWSLMRTNNFATTAPKVVKVQFKALVKYPSSASQKAFEVAVGDGFTDGLSNSTPGTDKIYTGFSVIGGSSAGNAKVCQFGGGYSNTLSSTTITDNSELQYTWVINNSSESFEYTDPKSNTQELAAGTWDLWIGNTLYVDGQARATAGNTSFTGTTIQEIYFGNSSGNRYEVILDDIVVTDLAPSSGSSCYTVTYDGNGADGGNTYDGNTYAANDDPTVLANGFTKTGYLFKGWAATTDHRNAGTVDYQPGNTISDINDNITLYAVWNDMRNKYTFHYGKNATDTWTVVPFTQVDETERWEVTDFEIPNISEAPDAFVGKAGQFVENFLGSYNVYGSRIDQWNDGTSVSAEIELAPGTSRVSGSTNTAEGAIGTLVINDNDMSGSNLDVAFWPDGYGLTIAYTENAVAKTRTIAFHPTPSDNIWETDIISTSTSTNLTTEQLAGTFTVGLATATANTYVNCYRSNADNAAAINARKDDYSSDLSTTVTGRFQIKVKSTLDVENDNFDLCFVPLENHSTGRMYWDNDAAWSLGHVPTIEETVYIHNSMYVREPGAVAKNLRIDKVTSSYTSLTIESEGGLLVEGDIKVKTDAEGDYTNHSTKNDVAVRTDYWGNGYLIVGGKSTDTEIEYRFYTKACNYGYYGYINQFIGIPFTTMNVYDFSSSSMYEYDNVNDKWVAASTTMEPFKAYNILRKKITSFNYFYLDGNLNLPGIGGDRTNKVLTCGSRYMEPGADLADESGDYLFANSFTAPIDMTAMEAEDFNGGTGMIQTIYIFNAGSVRSMTLLEDDDKKIMGDNPGEWSVFPIADVKASPSDYKITGIPAMQAFLVKATTANATLTLDYKKHVYDPALTAGTASTHGTLAPRRDRLVSYDLPKLKVFVTGESGYQDKIYIREDASFSEDLDNGWEGEKMFGMDVAPQFYAKTRIGKMAVTAVPDVEGMLLGLRPGTVDSVYTISFDYNEIEGPLYLYDMETGIYTEVTRENTYSFFTWDNEDRQRFMLTRHRAPQVVTGGDEVNAEADMVTKFVHNDKIYILYRGVIYDTTGKRVNAK